ncbi:alpha/beta fold hydrolase [Rhodoferax ferrireducens]|uniref:alpha/beta fold hydrolase n=1 Tax=Rhodoferax ferrireducens TaxID=192843 RepID=UPI000E0DCBA6|nr:alpha/beta fold hydrolase [Rhodoferax ferrireducens]
MIFMNRRDKGTAPIVTLAPMPARALYPDFPPFARHEVPVGKGHVLHVQEHGCADGVAVVVLHGGPGSGCAPLLRRYFDPGRYRVVCIDQRGAGLSRPRGSVAHNTTAHLLRDLRLVRAHLVISRWLVVGGSWGATLALAHAAAEPEAVTALLLRAVFLAREQDIDWFFQGARALEPQAWSRFAAVAPARQQEAMLPFLAQALAQGERAQAGAAALAWWRWEQALAGAGVPDDPGDALLDGLIDRYRVQSHYLLHRCWLDAPPLLDRCAEVQSVPTLLLHGLADRVCRPESAQAVQCRLPHSRLRWVEGAGHDPSHPAMVAAMVGALDGYAVHGDFGAGDAR